MMKYENPLSFIGDSWINQCHYSLQYDKTMGSFFSILTRWTQPNFLVIYCLILLFVLPILFLSHSDESQFKLSRLYNVSRLSILTFFHRVLYVYLFCFPFSLLMEQHSPCRDAFETDSEYNKTLNFPSINMCGLCFTALFFASFFAVLYKKLNFAFGIFLIIYSIHIVFTGELSLAQSFFSLSISYIFHFYSMRVPFWVMHIENVVFPIFFFTVFIIKWDLLFGTAEFLGEAILALALWIADFFMFVRYHFTRAGFFSLGRPIDIKFETESKSAQIASSEVDDNFFRNLTMDLVDSSIALFLYILGLIIQRFVI